MALEAKASLPEENVERRTPFGAFSLGTDAHLALTVPDAVRRCSWISIDLNAEGFGVFTANAGSAGTPFLPCFDSDYPRCSAATRNIASCGDEALLRHLHVSTLPCWWSASESGPLLGEDALAVATRVTPLVPDRPGLAFPVTSDRGQAGLVVFYGAAMAVDEELLLDSHARCFWLFNAVAPVRQGEFSAAPAISRRELECLTLTAKGCTSEVIAEKLGLSVHTTNQHLASTAQKLNATSRIHAVAKAVRMGLVD